MACDASSVCKLRAAMFAFNAATSVASIKALRAGMAAMSQANPPAADLAVEPVALGGVAAVPSRHGDHPKTASFAISTVVAGRLAMGVSQRLPRSTWECAMVADTNAPAAA